MLHQTLLLAQAAGDNDGTVRFFISLAAIAGLAALLFFMFVILLVKQFKRCPSNRVLVIYGRTGKGQASKTVHGGADFVWPLIQDYAYLSLEPIQIEVPLRGRSEEHTSELQSPCNIVCRLLLEKKKSQADRTAHDRSQVYLQPMYLRTTHGPDELLVANGRRVDEADPATVQSVIQRYDRERVHR